MNQAVTPPPDRANESVDPVHPRRVLEDLSERLSFKFAMVQRLLDRQMLRLLADTGLTVTAYRVLALVDAFGESSAADLSRRVGIDKGLLSRLIAELMGRGLLRQRADPTHKRRRLLGITPAGQELLARIEGPLKERNAALDALYDTAELQRLHDFLDRLLDHATDEAAQAQNTHTAD